jgi:hypothetical protein
MLLPVIPALLRQVLLLSSVFRNVLDHAVVLLSVSCLQTAAPPCAAAPHVHCSTLHVLGPAVLAPARSKQSCPPILAATSLPWPPLQVVRRSTAMADFLDTVLPPMIRYSFMSGESALVQDTVSPELAACLVKALDTLLGYHRTHQQLRSGAMVCAATQ